MRMNWVRHYSRRVDCEQSSFLESKQSFEFLNREACILDDLSHSEGVDWIVPRNDHNPNAITHDSVFGLANNLKTGLFQRTNGKMMVDARQLGHTASNRDDFMRNFGAEPGRQFLARFQVFLNRLPDVLQRFLPGRALAATAGQFIAPDRKSFFRLDNCNRVIHASNLACCGLVSRKERGWTSFGKRETDARPFTAVRSET